MPSSDKWKHFERLVAAIHRAADEGADVRWNDLINGRQFDVTIRFKRGFYNYLTVIECKAYASPVPVEKVEAFVTKATDVHANRAVMASTSGFQSGAQEVAQRHNISLLQVIDSFEVDFSVFGATVVDTTDVLHFQSIELEYVDGETKKLPEESHKQTYYAKQILFRCGSERATLDEIIVSQSSLMVDGEAGVYKTHTIELPADTTVISPDDGEIPLKPVERIHVRAGIGQAAVLDGPIKLDPYLFSPSLKVKDVASGEERVYNQHHLRLGVNNTFVPGQFYEQPQLDMYYFCESTKGDIAHLFLVESFQHGQLIQAELEMKTEYADRYVPVADKKTILRLQRRIQVLKGGPQA